MPETVEEPVVVTTEEPPAPEPIFGEPEGDIWLLTAPSGAFKFRAASLEDAVRAFNASGSSFTAKQLNPVKL